MSLWSTLGPKFPDRFESSDRMHFTHYDGKKWITDKELDADKAKWWEDNVHAKFEFYPNDVVGMLSNELPHFARADFYGIDPVSGKFSVSLIGNDGLKLASMSGHTIFLDEVPPRLNIDLAGTEKEYRRQGYAGRLLLNTYLLAEKFGITIISLKAQLEDGPYVWPLFGFVPRSADWEAAKPHIRAMLRLIEEKLTPSDIRDAEEALASGNPERIRDIVRLGTALTSTRRLEPGECAETVTAGYVLLAESGIEWYGELDFDDDPSWALFEDRVSKVMP